MVDKKYKAKIKTVDEIKKIIGPFPRQKKAIMCHGVFDVVHPGHIRHLMYARSKGDVLIASLTCDAHIGKRNFRPFVTEDLRALNLAALDMVDFVIIDHEPTPLKSLAEIQPNYFAKGFEYVDQGLNPKTQEEKDILDSYGGEIIFTPGDVVYSSSSLIEMSSPNIAMEKLAVLMEAEDLTFDNFRDALAGLAGLRVYVVGDTIVDTHTHTMMIGGQTKTPTISVRFEEKTDYVGGAGIVAKHLRAAGAEVVFSTVLGDDALKDFVLNDLEEAGVEVRPVIDDTRPTTNKNNFICDNHRLLKVDTLDNRSISEKFLALMLEDLSPAKVDCVVFSDFRHGVFNPSTIPRFIDAIPDGTFRVADSQVASRWGNILDFQNFDLITPNEREARYSLGDQDSVVRPLALKLFKEANCRNMILKLGERGVIAYRERPDLDDVRSFFVVDSFANNIKDATGSGDALLSYATLSHIRTGNAVIATILGTIAAAIKCEREGNVPVTPKEINEKIDLFESNLTYGNC